jgi:hypothetical protein
LSEAGSARVRLLLSALPVLDWQRSDVPELVRIMGDEDQIIRLRNSG